MVSYGFVIASVYGKNNKVAALAAWATVATGIFALVV